MSKHFGFEFRVDLKREHFQKRPKGRQQNAGIQRKRRGKRAPGKRKFGKNSEL